MQGSPPLPRRIGGQYVADALCWGIAVFAAQILRFDFEVERIAGLPSTLIWLCLAFLQLAVGWIAHLYRARHLRASFAEVGTLVLVVGAVGSAAGIVVAILGVEWGVPRSTVFLATPLALVGMAAVRYVRRHLRERSSGRPSEDAAPVLVYGAGSFGAMIVSRMLSTSSPYLPVGLIDDDPGKRNMRLAGVRVLGTGRDLAAVQEATGATTLVVAIARADASLLRTISDRGRAAGMSVKVFPLFEDVIAGKSRLGDLRDISIEDLIGRHPVDTNVAAVAGYIAGRRVLVTGAGGSIGSELCRQLKRFEPAELIMLDRDETGLQSTTLSIAGDGLLQREGLILADIRDTDALDELFAAHRPDVVFHAAALKHLPMLERYPAEAWKTNVIGTLNVLKAARKHGVETFVNISTDKAADPTSVLGHSKRLAEGLTAWAGEDGRRYLSVRFGNVLGSRGSVVPILTAQIEAGGPVTITHPDATRYFMTIPEACQLVIQAGAIGRPGEVLILDMGSPVRILDIANRMIEMSGRDIPIVFTGLRPGEKLHEDLLGMDEVPGSPIHPGITHTIAEPLRPEELDALDWTAPASASRGERDS